MYRCISTALEEIAIALILKHCFITAAHDCTDVDECAAGLHDCDQICTVTSDGWYNCSCEDGFTFDQDKHTCEGKVVVYIHVCTVCIVWYIAICVFIIIFCICRYQ